MADSVSFSVCKCAYILVCVHVFDHNIWILGKRSSARTSFASGHFFSVVRPVQSTHPPGLTCRLSSITLSLSFNSAECVQMQSRRCNHSSDMHHQSIQVCPTQTHTHIGSCSSSCCFLHYFVCNSAFFMVLLMATYAVLRFCSCVSVRLCQLPWRSCTDDSPVLQLSSLFGHCGVWYLWQRLRRPVAYNRFISSHLCENSAFLVLFTHRQNHLSSLPVYFRFQKDIMYNNTHIQTNQL